MKNLVQLLDSNSIVYFFKGANLTLYIDCKELHNFKVSSELDIEYVINKLNLK